MQVEGVTAAEVTSVNYDQDKAGSLLRLYLLSWRSRI